MQKTWLKHYPAEVPAELDFGAVPTLVQLLDDAFRTHAELPACRFLGATLRYRRIDDLARALAAYLQGLGLARGDRVAVMLPNVPQYFVAVAAVLRAGYVVVNVNPQYTPRELEHQLRDSGAAAIVVLENCASTLQQVLGAVPTRHVVVTALGDLLPPWRRALVNHLVRRVRKLVKPYSLPGAVPLLDALARGRRMTLVPAAVAPDDIAVLQYTGGTTGASKGAVLLHRNLVANLLQSEAWYRPALARIPPGEQPVTVCALPLYHVFGFNVVMMLGLRIGGCSLLIPDARDIPALLRTLARERFHSFPGVNTLYNAIAHHPQADRVDWSRLKLAVAGGMAVHAATAKAWLDKTGCPLCEGYGLSETSPSVTCNPVDTTEFTGTIGLPLPSTEVALLDDEGREQPPGTPGEIAIRGPQVMAGYWQRPDETAKAITPDGWFRSGDIGSVDSQGRFRVVDRKKDMILAGGFNVYPNEVEDVVTLLDGVLECAVVGVPDERAGETVKLIVVRTHPATDRPTEADVRAWCEAHLTGYKRPRRVEFRDSLPKSAVGKVLRRELR